MGIFDKAKDALSEHSDKVEQGLDKVADLADQKTGGKHSAHIDKGVDFARDKLNDQRAANPERPV